MSDILWQNNNGQTMAWIMNSQTVTSQVTLGLNTGSAFHLAVGGSS